jgi:hypothetical protein
MDEDRLKVGTSTPVPMALDGTKAKDKAAWNEICFRLASE